MTKIITIRIEKDLHEKFKAKHGNVTGRIRELIAKDLDIVLQKRCNTNYVLQKAKEEVDQMTEAELIERRRKLILDAFSDK